MSVVSIIINLIVAVLVYLFAMWILSYTPLVDPFKTLLAIVLAVLAFVGNPYSWVSRG